MTVYEVAVSVTWQMRHEQIRADAKNQSAILTASGNV